MQKLTQIITDSKKKGTGNNGVLNILREYLQVLILKAIYQSQYGKSLSFMGGTCLRICHDLKRYSEDLDFALDRKSNDYSLSKLNHSIASFLSDTGFEVDFTASEDKIVEKSFIRVSKVLHAFELSPLQSQKIHIKLEVDTNPVKVSNAEIETFFVTKFNEMFPILKHTDQTMFAGKICAILNRAYTKGRDFYDLIWYLNRKMDINFGYINRVMKQAGLKSKFTDHAGVITILGKKIEEVSNDDIMKDLGRFLEDPSEEAWLRQYPQAFKQASLFAKDKN